MTPDIDTSGVVWMGGDNGTAVREEIAHRFREFGLRPQCRGCHRPCKQYAAPDSIIVYCRRGRKP